MEVMFKKIDSGDARQFVSEGEKQALGQLDLSGKGNIIATHVTSSKIRNARGTREKYPSQEQVMGNSATAVAQTFRWFAATSESDNKDKGGESDKTAHTSLCQNSTSSVVWGSPRFAAAEWLHRSAYSWGGLGGQNPGTSQIFRNLVFGTSETPS
ncbi:hypothetical protein BDV27DRAFT_152255 [Aspergillus caelatus]|uniref:Uncharacterized protein n=1 Tax=Aspergillus caelatus TaxID=61420 RepID=A0A5N7AKC2_9EURO|nr:uncharacterized protein BDV27DRAFT_152255 [Aspergillus caelatus]KAE8370374.1 hypothetical protein BDV27DRAFT_152255 [Aspergillus caelatus]